MSALTEEEKAFIAKTEDLMGEGCDESCLSCGPEISLLAIIRRLDGELDLKSRIGRELCNDLYEARREAEVIRNVFCSDRQLPWEQPTSGED